MAFPLSSVITRAAKQAARYWTAPLTIDQGDVIAYATDPRGSNPLRWWPGSPGSTILGGSSVWRQARDESDQLLVHASHGNLAGIHQCLADGVDVNTQSPLHATALMMASQRGDFDSVSTLLEARASVNHRSLRGNSALLFAVSAGHSAVARLLREHGAEV
mmetsp:Transcript_56649/g.104871  ORF Transcript_56649/g.104871 Transcript_56649/m.104871 type:complete len:161 (-) Transcript_56649:86-568(-)